MEEQIMSTIAFEAMMFAREVHKDQVRKYTGNPYADHLAEVAGIVATVAASYWAVPSAGHVIAVAWLHDCAEDQGITRAQLTDKFGVWIASGVMALSDLEEGNRAERKALSRARLAKSSSIIQSIKCADLISNTSSIVKHDQKFAVTYLEEKRLLLDAMTIADPRLLSLARSCAENPAHFSGGFARTVSA
jgi:GTP diphosphokinase / guanosine-3',5'-bis(diphosphate) 3'-diphosphatase